MIFASLIMYISSMDYKSRMQELVSGLLGRCSAHESEEKAV